MSTPKSELLTQLFSHYENKVSGTFFITTDENRACQLVLKGGQIISMSFGKVMGDEVLNALRLMQVVRFSFKKDLILPMPAAAQVSSSKEIIQVLGYYKSKNIESSSNTPLLQAKSNKLTVRYRGQVVQKTIPDATLNPAPELKSKKPQVIYRGQVVYG